MLKLSGINIKAGSFSLKNISLEVHQGDYYVIVGESGAGKSVLLELIAGMKKPDSGKIVLNGIDITHSKIQHRMTGMVFQDFALFPHMNVYDNIRYSLKNSSLSRHEKENLINETAVNLSINHLLHRKTNALSGGEMQRVALARTLIQKPTLLLLDEPLSSLDILLKNDFIELLRKLHEQGQTILHVTHHYEEAIILASRIAVMNNGTIEQEGTSDEIFLQPSSEFVARFAGIRNFFRSCIVKSHQENLNCAQISPDVSVIITEKPFSEQGFIIIPADMINISFEQGIHTENCFEGVINKLLRFNAYIELVVDVGVLISVNIPRNNEIIQKLQLHKKVFVSFPAQSVKFIPL